MPVNKCVTKVKLDILQQVIDTYQPLGLFYTIENHVYIGVDNHNGHAWTEEFSDLYHCKRWLLNPNIICE